MVRDCLLGTGEEQGELGCSEAGLSPTLFGVEHQLRSHFYFHPYKMNEIIISQQINVIWCIYEDLGQ